MSAIVGEDHCCFIRTAPTFEELESFVHVSEDGSSISSRFGKAKIAAISEADLAAFCCRVLLRKDNVNEKYLLTGPTVVGTSDFAEAVKVRVAEDPDQVFCCCCCCVFVSDLAQ